MQNYKGNRYSTVESTCGGVLRVSKHRDTFYNTKSPQTCKEHVVLYTITNEEQGMKCSVDSGKE